MRKTKVTIYIREHGTQRYVRVKRGTEIRKDAIFVLRYAGKWETLKDCTSLAAATALEIQKELDLFRQGTPQPKPRLTVKVNNDPQVLDLVVDKYLSARAAQRNWRKHTRQSHALGLKLFLQSLQPSGKTRLNEIEGDDLRNYTAFLRKHRTSTGKRYDDRSVYNHFLNVVTFLNAHGRRNLVEQWDWPRYEKKKVKPFDEADLARLLQFADEDEADVIEFYLGIGFRNGEGEHVEWPDIDLRNKEVHVYSKKDKFNWEVKDSEQRIVGISDRLAERLAARHKRYPGNGLVFPNTNTQVPETAVSVPLSRRVWH